MRGRKPLPTSAKIAAGNPGKRRLNLREPNPSGLPRCPQHLSDAARKEWRRIVRILVPLRILTAADQAALAVYCAAWARWVDADEKARIVGEVIKTQSGNAIQNPYRSIANRAEETMLKAAAEFGMTPSSRSRLSVAPPAGKSLRELLAGDDPECSTPVRPN